MPRTFGLPHMSAPLRAGVGRAPLVIASRCPNYRLRPVWAAASDDEDVRELFPVGCLTLLLLQLASEPAGSRVRFTSLVSSRARCQSYVYECLEPTLQVENLVIIGSGPAGYTAAIYASRASLSPKVFCGFSKGGVQGGQLMTTTEIENFPGFIDIAGPDLMDRMRAQAEKWGSELLLEDVESVDLSSRPFIINGMETTVKANSIILATGRNCKAARDPLRARVLEQGDQRLRHLRRGLPAIQGSRAGCCRRWRYSDGGGGVLDQVWEARPPAGARVDDAGEQGDAGTRAGQPEDHGALRHRD